ncbi:DUF2141 domain-containing protein [Malonomonas rubra]|uniref:DUF2141 domain-containing protein n=1 Tax=Malonomonas rubra TaxID=57040 RepID=UPI001379EBBC|nr:DUF2141 domain-containing protein [Malonomonas rubra]
MQLSGIDTDKGGRLRVALFRGEQGWPKLENATLLQQLAAGQSEIEVLFSDLPYADDYAVEVHHDENGNGKFDMRWLPYPRPKEGVGVSNNSSGFGHPSFDSARFSFSRSQQEISIHMRY